MAKEIPYSKIDPREMKDLEAEFGRTLTPELAQCLIRYRINRDAIELMLGRGPSAGASLTGVSEMKPKSEDDVEVERKLTTRQPARGTRHTDSGAARKAVA